MAPRFEVLERDPTTGDLVTKDYVAGIATGPLVPPAIQTAIDASVATALASLSGGGVVAAAPRMPAANGDTATTGTLSVNKHNYVSAAGGNRVRALPTTANAGDLVLLEKADSSVNTVSATGSIRGVASSTFTLKLQGESILFEADGANSWWPILGHKTLSSLVAMFMPAETFVTAAASGAAYTVPDGTTKLDLTLTANCTVTLPAIDLQRPLTMLLRQDATGGRTATFALGGGGAPLWGASGIPPTLTATANARDLLVFDPWGTTYFGGLANKDIR